MTDHLEVNRIGWDALNARRSVWSVPWAPDGAWLDDLGVLPWETIHDVLVLAGGGGQQAPAFAARGTRVTLVDLSEAQLAVDRRIAAEHGLPIECLRGDMCDLSVLAGRTFDLVYQAPSSCYVPDPRACYRAVASVLLPGGRFLSQHWNPAQIQLSDTAPWDGTAYRLSVPLDDGPRPMSALGTADGPVCWHYVHPLGELIGGICDAGFVLERIRDHGPHDPDAPPGSHGHLGTFLPAFLTVLARRTDANGTTAGDQP